MKKLFLILIILCFSFNANAARFFNLFAYHSGGNLLHDDDLDDDGNDVDELAKFDIIIMNDGSYNDGQGSITCSDYDEAATGWNELCTENPNIEIYAYLSTTKSFITEDCAGGYLGLNSVAHYDNNCGEALDILTDHDTPGGDDYFLRDNVGGNVEGSYANQWWLEVGDATVQAWINSAINIIYNGQVWEADGLYSDTVNCNRGDISTFEADYNTEAEWEAAIESFLGATQDNQDDQTNPKGVPSNFVANVGGFNRSTDTCRDVWLGQDASAHPMYAILTEHGFHDYFGTGDVQFRSAANWLRIIQAMQMNNTKGMIQSTNENIGASSNNCGGTCVDNNADTVTYGQIVFFSLSSFAIGKTANSYYGYSHEHGIDPVSYNTVVWLPYYDEMNEGGNLHFGDAVGSYANATLGGQDIYYREFADGYIYVNPQKNDAISFNLPQTCIDSGCKVLDASNYSADLSDVTPVSAMTLAKHTGVFVRKASTGGAGTIRGASLSGASFPSIPSCPPWFEESIFSWDGQHPDGHNTGCETDGTINEADTDTANTADIGSGVIGIVLDDTATGGEGLRWNNAYVDGSAADQTICLKIQVNTDFPHDGTADTVQLFTGGDGTDDQVIFYTSNTGDDDLFGKFFTNAGPDPDALANDVTLDTPVTVAYSWETVPAGADQEHAVHSGDTTTSWATNWEEDADDIDSDMDSAATRMVLGNTLTTAADAGESIWIIQMALVAGYRFDCTTLTGW